MVVTTFWTYIILQTFQRSQEFLFLYELNTHKYSIIFYPTTFPKKFGGDERSRTAGLPLAKRTLYQLSYIPSICLLPKLT